MKKTKKKYYEKEKKNKNKKSQLINEDNISINNKINEKGEEITSNILD
jgi:hypothetical protein